MPGLWFNLLFLWMIGYMGMMISPLIAQGLKEIGLNSATRYLELYRSWAIKANRRIMFIIQGNTVTMKASNYNDRGCEEVQHGGRTLEFKDEADTMGRLYNIPCGIAVLPKQTIINPVMAHIASQIKSRRAQDEFVRHIPGTKGDRAARLLYLAFNQYREYVDIGAASAAPQGEGDPELPSRVEDLVEKSQQGFNSKTAQVIEYGALLMAFGAGIFAVYMLAKMQSDVSIDSVQLPMQITLEATSW